VTNTYGGNFFMPSIRAYAMYDESIIAITSGTQKENPDEKSRPLFRRPKRVRS
jgi:hypothetical protein